MENIIKKIKLKKGTSEGTITKMSNNLEETGNFIESGYSKDGTPYIVARFDDELDYLAFCVATGVVTMSSIK